MPRAEAAAAPTTPELNALIAAAEAMQAARTVAEQATAAAEHMERVGSTVYELLAPLLPPDGPPGESSGKLNLAAAARIFRRRRKVRRLA